jgi:hypothetical protein
MWRRKATLRRSCLPWKRAMPIPSGLLVAAGADVNKALPDGNTPILIASNLKQPAAVVALLDAGAKPTVADKPATRRCIRRLRPATRIW